MAKVLEPTYYGPVGQQGEGGGTAVDSQTAGSLTQLVMQPCDVTFTGDWWNGKYTEVWKGPYSVLKDLPATKMKPGLNRADAIASVGAGKLVQRFSAPDPGKDQWGVQQVWVVDSCQCRECAAGDHGILTVQYVASSGYNWSGSAQQDKGSETWQLDWQPYSLRPYAFCKNLEVQDPDAKGYQENRNQTAWRKNIEDFFRSPKGNKSEFEYQNPTGSKLLCLNYAERNIAKKVMLDRSCIWHYPLVTHVTVSRNPVKADTLVFDQKFPENDLGADLDHATDSLPSGCPYDFADSGWKWLKVADNVTETRTKTEVAFTRRQVYQGMKEPDVNFYGNQEFSHSDLESTRWEIAKI